MSKVLSKSLLKARKEGRNPIIAEVKVYSPKYGDLLMGRDPIKILKIYEECEVAGISYITAKEFKGDEKLLKELSENTELPVLRKDFIKRKEDIERTSELGASAVLLISKILKDRTSEFVDYALEHGVEPLVEVHTTEDIAIVNETRTPMIGINNRDIFQMEKDDGSVEVTERLYKYVRRDALKISESGISTLEHLTRALKCADAVLIGTAFMRARNLREIVRNFVRAP
jgi:indole-3-glycerol phosphate synthase